LVRLLGISKRPKRTGICILFFLSRVSPGACDCRPSGRNPGTNGNSGSRGAGNQPHRNGRVKPFPRDPRHLKATWGLLIARGNHHPLEQRKKPDSSSRTNVGYTAAAIAFPTSSVDAEPPMSRVLGPLSRTFSIALMIAPAASCSPRCSSIIAPDQIWPIGLAIP